MASSLGISPNYLFVAPPNVEHLKERLELRGTEEEEDILLRLRNANSELMIASTPGLFDHTLVNSNFSETTTALFRLIRRWYPAMPNPGRLRSLQRRMRNLKNSLRGQGSNDNL